VTCPINKGKGREIMNTKSRRSLTLLGMTLAIGLLLPGQEAAHCDTLDGPVVADARTALA
jgi:hypothetical protein